LHGRGPSKDTLLRRGVITPVAFRSIVLEVACWPWKVAVWGAVDSLAGRTQRHCRPKARPVESVVGDRQTGRVGQQAGGRAGTDGHGRNGALLPCHRPGGRRIMPQDIVGTAIWLASPASDYVTGAAIAVDGGFSSSLF